MKFAAALALVGCATAHGHLREIYTKYLAQHNKNYLSEEEFELRFENFAKTHHAIKAHNAQKKSWTLGHNFMSDWTEAEKNALNGHISKAPVTDAEVLDFPDNGATVDWRTSLKTARHVKNQGQCGSCWAFSTTGSIETHTEIADGSVKYLSEQQLVDCSTQNNGCEGGLYDYAFAYVASNGLESETEYPYAMADRYECDYASSKVVNHKVDAYTPYHDINAGDEKTFKARLAKGPVSIAVQANQAVFQQYDGGILQDDGSCGTQLDHAILAVGWGTSDDGTEYCIVKNSWGSSWGDNGFIKLGFGAGKSFWGGVTSACGFLNQSSQVVVDA